METTRETRLLRELLQELEVLPTLEVIVLRQEARLQVQNVLQNQEQPIQIHQEVIPQLLQEVLLLQEEVLLLLEIRLPLLEILATPRLVLQHLEAVIKVQVQEPMTEMEPERTVVVEKEAPEVEEDNKIAIRTKSIDEN